MDWTRAFSDVLPPLMHDPVTFAIPFFLLLLIIEWAAARKLVHTEAERPPAGRLPEARRVGQHLDGPGVGRHQRGHQRSSPCWATPRSTSTSPRGTCRPPQWYTWVIAIVGVDLLYYIYHRIAHRVRLIWATHQAHHSSQYFNFATALRQKWNISGDIFLRACCRCSVFRRGSCSPASRSTSSISSGSIPSASESSGGQSNSSSTRRRTTGCTTAWTSSTWTRTTAAS